MWYQKYDDHLNQRIAMETILSSCLRQVCRVLLTNSLNLNLLQSVAKMLKSSKFMAQLHCNRSYTAIAAHILQRLFNIFEAFSCKIGDFQVFSSHSGIKVAEGFHTISNLAVTTSKTINYFRANFFLKWIFKSKQCVKSALRSKNYFQFTIW